MMRSGCDQWQDTINKSILHQPCFIRQEQIQDFNNWFSCLIDTCGGWLFPDFPSIPRKMIFLCKILRLGITFFTLLDSPGVTRKLPLPGAMFLRSFSEGITLWQSFWFFIFLERLYLCSFTPRFSDNIMSPKKTWYVYSTLNIVKLSNRKKTTSASQDQTNIPCLGGNNLNP